MHPPFVIHQAMFGLSGWELLIILVIALLIFGRKLPDIMRGLGSSAREFKNGMSGDAPAAVAPPPTPAAKPPTTT